MDVIQQFKDAQKRAEQARKALHQLDIQPISVVRYTSRTSPISATIDEEVLSALNEIDDTVAKSYVQISADIQDSNRVSWAGTAHEIRELISHTLRILAPDEDVTKQSWYKPEKDTSGPTQKQRAIYILKQRSAGSKEEDVVKHIDVLDEKIANLVRDTYKRASVAAHEYKQQREVKRIFNYFNAFIRDLLDV